MSVDYFFFPSLSMLVGLASQQRMPAAQRINGWRAVNSREVLTTDL
jgi:hypothetical protein